MNNVLRWVAVVPASLTSFGVVLLAVMSLRGLLLRFCPAGDLGSEWTSDLSRRDYEIGGPICYAEWFQGAEMALLVAAFAGAVVAAGGVAAWVAPTRRLASGFSVAVLSILCTDLLFRFS